MLSDSPVDTQGAKFTMAKKILIVEDEILVGMMLKKRIESYGYEVCDIASTGHDAIEMAARLKPELLFMDVSLPGEIDGVTAAKRIKEKQHVSVVFFTGNHRDENLISRSEEIAPVAILDKMGPFSEVIAALEKGLLT